MHPKKSLSLLSLALVIAAGGYAQTLKPVFVKGDKYEQTTTTTVNSAASLMGQEVESIMNNTTVETIKVTDVSAAGINLAFTKTKIVVNSQAMGQEMNYDSDKKDNTGPLAEELDKTIGKVKSVSIDASGKEIKEDEESKGAGNTMAVISETAQNNIINTAFMGREIRQNMSWPGNATTSSDDLKTTTTGTYTVSSVNDQTRIATIDFTGIQTGTGTMMQMGMEMAMKFTNNVTTQYQLDLNTGIILQSNTTLKGTMDIEAGGMSIPTTITTSTVSKITKQ